MIGMGVLVAAVARGAEVIAVDLSADVQLFQWLHSGEFCMSRRYSLLTLADWRRLHHLFGRKGPVSEMAC
jgi:hypothetical protein